MKLTTERVVEQASPGWTKLRAVQFHDLILTRRRHIAQLHDRRLRHESQLGQRYLAPLSVQREQLRGGAPNARTQACCRVVLGSSF